VLREIDAAQLDETSTLEDMDKLPLLEMVMKETLRLYPVGAVSVRAPHREKGVPIA